MPALFLSDSSLPHKQVTSCDNDTFFCLLMMRTNRTFLACDQGVKIYLFNAHCMHGPHYTKFLFAYPISVVSSAAPPPRPRVILLLFGCMSFDSGHCPPRVKWALFPFLCHVTCLGQLKPSAPPPKSGFSNWLNVSIDLMSANKS